MLQALHSFAKLQRLLAEKNINQRDNEGFLSRAKALGKLFFLAYFDGAIIIEAK